MSNAAEPTAKIKPNLDIAVPPLYNAIYLNDEKTSMEFVIYSLVTYFDHTDESAYELTMKVHEEGSAVVAVLPLEICEQRCIEVVLDARQKGFPLQVKVEPVK